jgi:lysylphosphatidylglycerol synthetase-like protein (DUF2156 family)
MESPLARWLIGLRLTRTRGPASGTGRLRRQTLVAISRRETLLRGSGVVVVLLSIVVARYDRQLFLRLTLEDGFIESLTALALIATAGLCGYRAWRLRGQRGAVFIGATILIGLTYVVGAGEELSWGQRILGIKTPEYFVLHNKQQEINLHNLLTIQRPIETGLVVFVVGYLLVLPTAYRNWPAIRELADRLAVPVPHTRHAVAFVASYVALLWLIPTPQRRLGEVIECVGAIVFFQVTAFPLNTPIFRPR